MIVEWNSKKLHKDNKNFGEMSKVFKVSEIPKNGGHKHFSRKLQNTTKELDLDDFETTSRLLPPKRII